MAGYKQIRPEHGKQFSKDYQPTKQGRKPSIRRQLFELFESDGAVVIPANQVLAKHDDGSVTISVPTQMQVAMKLKSLALSRKGMEALKAIQMIIEQIDGGGVQRHVVVEDAQRFDEMTNEELDVRLAEAERMLRRANDES